MNNSATLTDVIWAPPLIPGLSQLENSKGTTYGEFRKTLITPYGKNQFGIVMTLFSIVPIVFSINLVDNVALLGLFAIILSLVEHRILNVVHEGAHYLIAKNKVKNDLICNLLAGWFVLVDVDQYRQTHVQHHRSLGSDFDPENSHQEKLDLTWLVSVFSGIQTLRLLRHRGKMRKRLSHTSPKSYRHGLMTITGLSMHLIILLFLMNVADLKTVAIWCLSTFLMTPGLGLIRNLLEHKYVGPMEEVIWTELSQQKSKSDPSEMNVTTRMFNQKKLSRVYGSMGFTRHLLHHWDPSISFSNLEKVHVFLLDTSLGANLLQTESTYSKAFLSLWKR